MLDALILRQRRLVAGKTPPEAPNFSADEQEMYEQVLGIMEMRRDLAPAEQKAPKRFSVIKKAQTIDDILLACLRRVQKSAKFWNKESGKQGYLRYVIQFLP